MPFPPSQYQASRKLEQICDLRMSISDVDYVDGDDWGRAARSAPTFTTRADAERALSGLRTNASRLRIEAPPPTPALTYPPPPRPPPYLQVDSSRDVSLADVATPPPGYPSSSNVGALAFAERASEPPSFGNLRDLSATSSRPRSPPPGARRPRGLAPPVPTPQAALADYIELNDEVLVERVFDDADEPLSATGDGHVASVPQSPHNLLKRWMIKMNAAAPPRIAAPAHGAEHDPPAPKSRGPSEFDRAIEQEIEPASEKTIADLVMLKSDIPDRPRGEDPHQYLEDEVVYFDEPGDTAIGDAYPDLDDLNEAVQEVPEVRQVRQVEEKPMRSRPKLREHVFTTIKSYHHTNLGFDDEDEYTTDDDSTVNSANTERSTPYGRKSNVVVRTDAVFEESDVSHSFEKAPKRRAAPLLS